jgi:hypothetical protein
MAQLWRRGEGSVSAVIDALNERIYDRRGVHPGACVFLADSLFEDPAPAERNLAWPLSARLRSR